ncbi:PPC domain-containing DNA-binding protein [Zophobihabitans entericus]|uniref:DNA-binding protein n=1 Tax=Zophobihabitans entericus TaxID=1635327 RepID=A0A6G9IAG2_9GAMM|nr:PPC domain-containing DNA-binding protein [Zophobihabitans entericus]QIQ20570.1 DNA-binding protein [Zophobihabitans entericus]
MSKTMRIQSVVGSLGRTIIARLLPGTDMLEGIEETCRQHGVKNGVILCAIGSLSQATFTYPISDASAKVGIVYCDPIVVPGPVEFYGGQGIICQSEQDEYLIHFHASASDESAKVFGGHFLVGNTILATLDLIISEVQDVKMLRLFDEETGFVQFSPER